MDSYLWTGGEGGKVWRSSSYRFLQHLSHFVLRLEGALEDVWHSPTEHVVRTATTYSSSTGWTSGTAVEDGRRMKSTRLRYHPMRALCIR